MGPCPDLFPGTPTRDPVAYGALKTLTVVVLDFETTGSVPGWPVEPWQVGMVTLREGRVDPTTLYSTLLRVGDRPFSEFAPGRHAVLRDQIHAAPAPREIWPALSARLLGTPLAAHNVGTERSQLRRMAPMHCFGPWIDTLRLARQAYPAIPDAALGSLIEHLGLCERVRRICPDGVWHDALYDAVACAVFLEHLIRDERWGSVDLAQIAVRVA